MQGGRRIRSKFQNYLRTSLDRPKSALEQFEISKAVTKSSMEISDARDSPRKRAVKWNESAEIWEKAVVPKLVEEEFDFLHRFGKIKKSDHVVSIGSGLGIMENFIAKEMVQEGTVTCIDFSHKMNIRAKRRGEQIQAKNIRFITADADKLPLKSAAYDKVICTEAILPVFAEWKHTLHEVRRILKGPDSRFILTFNAPNKGAIEDAISSLKRSGFAIEKSELFQLPMVFANVMIVAKPK